MSLDRVVLAGYYPPPLGGESVHVADLARGLRARGIHVDVVNLRRGATASPEYRRVSGIFSLLTGLRRGLGGGALLHLHTNGHSAKSWSVVLAGAAALTFSRAVGILTLHSGFCPGYLARRGGMARAVIRFAVAPFAHVVCVNDAIRDALVKVGVPASRLSVLPAYLGLDAPGLLNDTDARSIEGFAPYLVAAAATDPEYGLPALIDAIDRLRRRHPRVGCVVMGAGDVDALRAEITHRGLGEHVICLGEVPHTRYLAFLARADVFVRPSIVDGDAISVREALALGRRVVASDTDFRPDGVIKFRRGDPADLADKVTTALGTRATGVARDMRSFERLLGIYAAAVQTRRTRP
ncbi:MAG TPA: glycosyltransferase family 4 protein [Methylomirabilota bacterium]